jgi:twitching motility protein PilT
MPVIDKYLLNLLSLKGSDLHLSAGCPPMVRKDGDLNPLEPGPLTAQEIRALFDEILPERNRAEFDETHDTDFAYAIPEKGRFRVNVFMDCRGPGSAIRAIPSRVLTADELSLPGAVRQLCELEKGLVLVTGPTGSGKSTTLAAMIDLVNSQRSGHILTIEDPVEFVHLNKRCLVNQREVGVHTRSFAAALRAALREDPNVVLLGELRDLETTAIALETAETGHLVFGTLHTSSAATTVDRMIDQFPAGQQEQVRTMLAASLRAVIAQTLVKKIGGGRLAALEILLGNPAVASNIREGKTHQLPSAIQMGMKQGMILLNDALLKLVVNKDVDPHAALAKAIDKDDLMKKLLAAGFLGKRPAGENANWQEINFLAKGDQRAAPAAKGDQRPAPAAKGPERPPLQSRKDAYAPLPT